MFRCTVWTDKYIVTGADDGLVMLFDFTLGEVVHTFRAHDGMQMPVVLCSYFTSFIFVN